MKSKYNKNDITTNKLAVNLFVLLHFAVFGLISFQVEVTNENSQTSSLPHRVKEVVLVPNFEINNNN